MLLLLNTPPRGAKETYNKPTLKLNVMVIREFRSSSGSHRRPSDVIIFPQKTPEESTSFTMSSIVHVFLTPPWTFLHASHKTKVHKNTVNPLIDARLIALSHVHVCRVMIEHSAVANA